MADKKKKSTVGYGAGAGLLLGGPPGAVTGALGQYLGSKLVDSDNMAARGAAGTGATLGALTPLMLYLARKRLNIPSGKLPAALLRSTIGGAAGGAIGGGAQGLLGEGLQALLED